MSGLAAASLARAAGLGAGAGAALAGLLLAAGQAAVELSQAPRTIFRVETTSSEPPLRAGRVARLPKGSAVLLQPGQGEAWRSVVRSRGPERAVLRRVKRLRGSKAAWALLGSGPEPSIPLPRLTRALRSLTVTATAYDPGPVDNTRGWVGTTSSGERARHGIAAVDPRVIPQGSLLYVEGYGPALAADRGGAIKGARVDLCFNRTREALAWGRKKVRVWVLEQVPRKERAALESRLFGEGAPPS